MFGILIRLVKEQITIFKEGAVVMNKTTRRISLRQYFKIETIAIFTALLLISGSSLFSLNQAISLSNTIVEKSLTDIHSTMSLRLSLNRSAMPVNDYIIHADPEEKIQYMTLKDETDYQFKLIATTMEKDPVLQALLAQALLTWNQTNVLAEDIFLIDHPIGNTDAAEKMEQFDALVDRGTDILSRIYSGIYQNTIESQKQLDNIKLRATLLIILLSFIGLLVAIFGSIRLASLFFPPLEKILAGVRLFGRGKLSHRIGNEMPVELTELADGVNDMAGRLDDIYSELRKSSYRDSLTGCYNRRKLDEDMMAAFSLARRKHENLAVLMLDLDLFKLINDKYGHVAGDSVLLSTAEIIRSQLRKHEILYRYGGEEFIIILPATRASDAFILAERIRISVGNKKMDVGSGAPVSVTVSIGIADNAQEDSSIQNMIELADKALYTAKESGRNRVTIA